jgi:hypothetical protein
MSPNKPDLTPNSEPELSEPSASSCSIEKEKEAFNDAREIR